MVERRQLRYGIFHPPFHPWEEDPTLCMERDYELMQILDRLGFDEAWIGEHHSGGYEIYGAPDLFIAAAAMITKRIRLGTGVLSLAYHNPFLLADRMIQLDHQTRGRAMFGMGPGFLPSDASILNIEPSTQRERMDQSIGVITRLMRGETVTEKTDWYDLREARLQLRPYSYPRPRLAVSSAITPNAGKLAGKYGLGMICVAVASAKGYDSLDVNWQVANDTAAQHGNTMDRGQWALMAPFHIAETREKALENCKWGFDRFIDYTYAISPIGGHLLGCPSIKEINELGLGAIGTPDDALAVLEKLWTKTGGFGSIVMLGHNWADWEQTKRSYEMFARYVMPRFRGSAQSRKDSMEWMRSNRDTNFKKADAAMDKAIDAHFKGAGKKSAAE